MAAPSGVGDIKLWVPEAIASDHGFCSVYPAGEPWRWVDGRWVQEMEKYDLFGPGNFRRLDSRTLECSGIQVPKDSPVSWHTTVTPQPDGAQFTIRLKNLGRDTIRKAGAAVCIKFMNAPWWSDQHVFVCSGGRIRTLGELGRSAGSNEVFEAYLLVGESYNNVFYQQFWSFNSHRLDAPGMVSENPAAGLCVAVVAERAYFLHSNKANPCTDLMLAFGDLPAGAEAEARGRILIKPGSADYHSPRASQPGKVTR